MSAAFLLFWMVWVMERSMVFEVSLTQDDDLFTFIHILFICEIYNWVFWLNVSGRQGGKTQTKGPLPKWAAINESPPCIPYVFAMKNSSYYLYTALCKLAVSCVLIGKRCHCTKCMQIINECSRGHIAISNSRYMENISC